MTSLLTRKNLDRGYHILKLKFLFFFEKSFKMWYHINHCEWLEYHLDDPRWFRLVASVMLLKENKNKINGALVDTYKDEVPNN